jgi:hypothetical protein
VKCVRYGLRKVEDVDRRKNVTCRFGVCFHALRSKNASKHFPQWSRFTTSHTYLCRRSRYQNWLLFSISCFKPRDNYVFIFNLFCVAFFSFLQLFLHCLPNFFLFSAPVSFIRRSVVLLLSSCVLFFPSSLFLSFSLRPLEFCFFSLIFRTFSCCRISVGLFLSFFHPLFCSFRPPSFWAFPIFLTAFRALFLFIFIRISSSFRYFFCPFSLLSSMLVICRRKRLEPLLCAIPSNPERV